jgi:hypothetical protein
MKKSGGYSNQPLQNWHQGCQSKGLLDGVPKTNQQSHHPKATAAHYYDHQDGNDPGIRLFGGNHRRLNRGSWDISHELETGTRIIDEGNADAQSHEW